MAEEFTLPSDGTIALRGLSGYEVMLARKMYGDDFMKTNILMLSFSGDMTEADAEHWMKTHMAGDYLAVINQINTLSGLGEGAPKSGVSSV